MFQDVARSLVLGEFRRTVLRKRVAGKSRSQLSVLPTHHKEAASNENSFLTALAALVWDGRRGRLTFV